MARNHSCLTTKFLFVSALFSWVIFRSVSGRTIFALRTNDEDDLCDRNRPEDIGECEYECVIGSLDTTLSELGQKMFKLFVNGRQQEKIILKKCLAVGTECGDATANREGRRRVCRQKHFKHTDALITLGITNNEIRQALPLNVLPNGCECVDPEDSPFD